MISFRVFMKFVDENGDARGILSKECFELWVSTRKIQPKQPEESFRRVLTAHICGVDGRRPFPVKVEQNLLKLLRKKKIWDCFHGTKVSIGIRGFRNRGYHETMELKAKKNMKEQNALKRKTSDDKTFPNKARKMTNQEKEEEHNVRDLARVAAESTMAMPNIGYDNSTWAWGRLNSIPPVSNPRIVGYPIYVYQYYPQFYSPVCGVPSLGQVNPYSKDVALAGNNITRD